jgi:hypothetical protein
MSQSWLETASNLLDQLDRFASAKSSSAVIK